MIKLHPLPHCHHHRHHYHVHHVLSLKILRCKAHCLWQPIVLSNTIQEPTMYVALILFLQENCSGIWFVVSIVTPWCSLQNVEGQHPYSAANNRGNVDACIASSQPPVPYNSGYAGHTNQIYQPPLPPPPPPPQPIATFPSGPHGSLCGPSVPHHGNNYHHPPPAPLPNSGYHLQPPPHPPGPNQFPCPPEPEQRAQPWNCGPPAPSYPERYQYDRGHHGYDRRPYFDDRGHHFDDRGHRFDGGGHYFDDGMHHFDDRLRHFHDRGQMHHEVMDGGRFPSFFPPGIPPSSFCLCNILVLHPTGPVYLWTILLKYRIYLCFSWIKLLCLASFVLISIQLILFLFKQRAVHVIYHSLHYLLQSFRPPLSRSLQSATQPISLWTTIGSSTRSMFWVAYAS